MQTVIGLICVCLTWTDMVIARFIAVAFTFVFHEFITLSVDQLADIFLLRVFVNRSINSKNDDAVRA